MTGSARFAWRALFFVSVLGVTCVGCGGSSGHGGVPVVTTPTLKSIAVTPAAANLVIGSTVRLAAIGTFDDATTADVSAKVTWSSSAPAVATIDATGLLTAVSKGTTTLTATLGSVTGSTTATVPAGTVKSLAINPANPTLNQGASTGVTLTATLSDNSTTDLTSTATWSIANTALAQVSGTGPVTLTATGLSGGTTTLTATVAGLSATTTVTVSGTPLQQIEFMPPKQTVPIGFPQQLNVIGTYADGSTQNVSSGVSYAVFDASIATISSSGVVTGQVAGVTTGTAAFGPVVAYVSITVTNAAVTAIRISPDKTPIMAVGQTQDFSAYADFADGTTVDVTASVSWMSDAATIGAITSAGTVSALNTGSANVSATISPTVSTSIALTVDGTKPHYTEHRLLFNYRDILQTGTFVISGDDRGANLPLIPGLTFNFAGTDYTTDKIWACTNGFVCFGGTSTSTLGTALPVALGNAILVDGDDQVSAIYYQVFGQVGSRQLVIQFDGGAYSSSSPGTSSAMAVQIVLYEGSNDIDLRWLETDPGKGFSSANGGDTVGIIDASSNFTEHSFHSKSILNGKAIGYRK